MSDSDTEHTTTRRSKRQRSNETPNKSTRKSGRNTSQARYTEIDSIELIDSQPVSDNDTTELPTDDVVPAKTRKNKKSTTSDDNIELLSDAKSYDQYSTELKPVTHTHTDNTDTTVETVANKPVMNKVKRKLPTFSAGSYTESTNIDNNTISNLNNAVTDTVNNDNTTDTKQQTKTRKHKQTIKSEPTTDTDVTNSDVVTDNKSKKRKLKSAVKPEPTIDDDVILIDSESSDLEPTPQQSTATTKNSTSSKQIKSEPDIPSDTDSIASSTNSKPTKKTKSNTKGKKKKYEFNMNEILDAFAVIDTEKRGFITKDDIIRVLADLELPLLDDEIDAMLIETNESGFVTQQNCIQICTRAGLIEPV